MADMPSIISSPAIDLSRLPSPDVVQAVSYAVVLAEMQAQLIAAHPEFDALLPSDPAIKVLEVAAYMVTVERQRVNDAARAVMIASALAADLENLGRLFGVERLELEPAQGDTPAVMESDTDLRRRILLAPDSYSSAGPRSAYIYHALTASGDVLDASATSPAPGEVVVSVLARPETSEDGSASPELIATVAAAVNADDVRPLTDQVTVQSASITAFAIEADVWLYAGPDAAVILAAAEASLSAFLADARRIGRDIPRSALIAALHVAGVQKVTLVSPAADLVFSDTQAGHAASIEITNQGTAE